MCSHGSSLPAFQVATPTFPVIDCSGIRNEQTGSPYLATFHFPCIIGRDKHKILRYPLKHQNSYIINLQISRSNNCLCRYQKIHLATTCINSVTYLKQHKPPVNPHATAAQNIHTRYQITASINIRYCTNYYASINIRYCTTY